MTFKPCAIVPTFNHHSVIAEVVNGLRQQDLPVIIVDDGSGPETRGALTQIAELDNNIEVIQLAENQGKGIAVKTGMQHALELGFTHAVQVDADGQHDANALPELLRLAQEYPERLISGAPIYDDSIPKSRKIGRWITHVWVWIETLSFQITDSMCGYRVYPLAACQQVFAKEYIGRRMDFDTEIMVRLFWRGTGVVMIPVRVTYPEENTSNFDVLWDNWRISKMHTRLTLGMVFRLPSILRNRPKPVSDPEHWSQLQERGVSWGVSFLAAFYRLLGRRCCLWMMQPILLYFYLTGGKQRKASRTYWDRIGPKLSPQVRPSWWRSFQHFRTFGEMALDKFAAWSGDITLEHLKLANQVDMDQTIQSGQGVVILASHLGNIEICRSLSLKRSGVKITVLAHTKHALQFNQVLRRKNPETAVDMIQVTELGPATAIELQDRLARGEWIVIAGDRTPVDGQERISYVDFLGEPAGFGQGAIILGALLKAPVYMMLCMKEGDKYNVIFEPLADQIKLVKGEKRAASINGYAATYAGFLERFAIKYPMQWYNFFDFWHKPTQLTPPKKKNRNPQ